MEQSPVEDQQPLQYPMNAEYSDRQKIGMSHHKRSDEINSLSTPENVVKLNNVDSQSASPVKQSLNLPYSQ